MSSFFDQSSFLHNEMEWQRKLRSEDRGAGRRAGTMNWLELLTDAAPPRAPDRLPRAPDAPSCPDAPSRPPDAPSPPSAPPRP